jgi:hypothetical protein
MRHSFRSQVFLLREYSNRFDPAGAEMKLDCLRNLSKTKLPHHKDLVTYFDTLLFMIAYPGDAHLLDRAEKELIRINKFLKGSTNKRNSLLDNSGMPFTSSVTRFSHDTVRWLLVHPHCNIIFHSFKNPALQLNDVLRLTLPSLEKSETTAHLSNEELLERLKVPGPKWLPFLMDELARLNHLPYIKDHFFEKLDIYVQMIPRDKFYSKAYNRLPQEAPYFHHELLKKFDIKKIINQPLNPPTNLTDKNRKGVIAVIKDSLAITLRETDPATYMEESSLRLFHLDRGISIAIYGMIPARQLPLESYVGYTAFKNGFPVAYGGAWILGERADFGINIFESFRNGESAYIMAQILRVYRFIFHVHYFEIEPFQFGLDNPEGIESGAFWFYYRFGFRSLDIHLRQLARKEVEKIHAKPGYRTSHHSLIRFTESNMALKLGKNHPPKVADITASVTRMIQRSYQGNRLLAEIDCRKKFLAKTGGNKKLDEFENQVCTEVALWAEAQNVKDNAQLELMKKMIKTKPRDVYAYQHLVISFFKDVYQPML